MPTAVLTVVAAYATQALAAVLLAAVLRGLSRAYRHEYLRFWEWSWWALAIHLATGAAGFYAAGSLAALHPARLGLALVSQVAGYWQVLWLLVGTYAVATGRRPERRTVRVLLGVLGVVAVATAAAYTLPDAPAARFFVRVGLRSCAAGVAFLVAGRLVWRGWFARGTSGRTLLSLGFVLYGAQQLHYFAIATVIMAGGGYPGYGAYLPLADVALQSVMGLGMTMWLLEEERGRVLLATRQVEHLALHDSVADLPNRRLIMDRLAQAIAVARRRGEAVAVLVFGLDRFTAVNDALGHASGDELLRAVASRLVGAVREGDTVGRLGGDEFCLVLPGAGETDAHALAGRILTVLRGPHVLRGGELVVTASAGLAVYPAHGGDGESLVSGAVAGMHAAKERGGNLLGAADGAVRGGLRLSLENALRRARERDELELYYQPIVRLDSGAVVAVEALLRWHHPELGLLPAREFVPLAERIGVIDALNMWAVDESVQAARTLGDEGFGAVRVTVNLSAPSFQQPELVDAVEAILVAADVAADRLVLEVTETIAMRDVEASIAVLRALKRSGVRIAIDDFGTGYSSLSYLRSFPIDAIKVDQSFVQGLPRDHTSAAILAAVVALARKLGVELVAEGVEREEQRASLREFGCELVQGFLVAHPMPLAACLRFVREADERARVRLRIAAS